MRKFILLFLAIFVMNLGAILPVHAQTATPSGDCVSYDMISTDAGWAYDSGSTSDPHRPPSVWIGGQGWTLQGGNVGNTSWEWISILSPYSVITDVYFNEYLNPGDGGGGGIQIGTVATLGQMTTTGTGVYFPGFTGTGDFHIHYYTPFNSLGYISLAQEGYYGGYIYYAEICGTGFLPTATPTFTPTPSFTPSSTSQYPTFTFPCTPTPNGSETATMYFPPSYTPVNSPTSTATTTSVFPSPTGLFVTWTPYHYPTQSCSPPVNFIINDTYPPIADANFNTCHPGDTDGCEVDCYTLIPAFNIDVTGVYNAINTLIGGSMGSYASTHFTSDGYQLCVTYYDWRVRLFGLNVMTYIELSIELSIAIYFFNRIVMAP